MTIILHITMRAAWADAQQRGIYEADSLRSEGFIHFSTAEQVLRVANAFYRGQSGLILLIVESEKLTAPLRFEPPSPPNPDRETAPSGELFPHLYGALNLDAVLQTVDFPPGDDGIFTLPPMGLTGL